MKRRVGIIGIGLIGGSIALSIKREHDVTVIGYDISTEQLHISKSLGVIDHIAPSVEECVKDVDFIILATPVTRTVSLLDELCRLPLKSGVIISDVGSTKQEIFTAAACFEGKDVHFIGGHPMAGSHKTGVSAARAHLFENAFYLLTPPANVESRAMIALQNLLKGTKARFLTLSPAQHDRMAGTVSHFPHIIAASLVHQLERLQKDEPEVAQLAAGGFRDITRIASASPTMWRDVLLHNKEEMLRLLDEWDVEMERIRSLIDAQDGDGIYRYFEDAKSFREGLPVRKRGAIPSFYDLYVDVPDHPGVISDVTHLLAEKQISITNIRILETREDIMGVLRLSFRSEEDRELGKIQLGAHMYETYVV
ncbi:prephenate dehydrogenase [Shouchella shacheensis]|uniref:prephenate dehydrogenase n=1 Tax=Shouchella shacheensis TaxID=1649580 RepID=UPI0007400115|nr:prephenate dehydrogenase [Shouchella shacheensis]